MSDLTKIEVAQSKLNVVFWALMAMLEVEPDNRDLSNLHILIGEINQDLKDAIGEN